MGKLDDAFQEEQENLVSVEPSPAAGHTATFPESGSALQGEPHDIAVVIGDEASKGNDQRDTVSTPEGGSQPDTKRGKKRSRQAAEGLEQEALSSAKVNTNL